LIHRKQNVASNPIKNNKPVLLSTKVCGDWQEIIFPVNIDLNLILFDWRTGDIRLFL